MTKGFSLIESLIAMTIAISVGISVFQLFHQNERLFRDQEIVSEMQQSGRAAGFQIADDIRLAGQGVPVFAATFDSAPDESTTVILNGSSSSRINFRAGISNIESQVVSTFPTTLYSGVTTTLTLQDAGSFSNGRGYVYLWGLAGPDVWRWIRASLGTVSAATNSIVITPQRTMEFSGPLTVSLEEAVAIYYDAATSTIRRTTATDLTDAITPNWAPANELVANVTALGFIYYDRTGQPKTPNSLADRSAIARVDINLSVQASTVLSTGERPTFTAHLSPVPGNLRSQ